MPLQMSAAPNAPVSLLNEWTVTDADRLVESIAWLYLQKQAQALRVIKALEPGKAALPGGVIQEAVNILTVRTDDLDHDLAHGDAAARKAAQDKLRNRIIHRDGLLFQHVSWIAASLSLPGTHAAPPHVRTADKGFDGVILELNPNTPGLSRIILCEDKASVDPRSLVTGSIWPEVKAIQTTGKDREILAAVTAILATLPGIDHEAVIDATAWEASRGFRVALTAGQDQLGAQGYAHLFAGFDAAAGGDLASRMAEVMPMPEVRPYLANLASTVIARLQTMG